MDDNIIKNLFPVRKPLRLKGWDYSSPGAYFVTICTYKKQCILGAVDNGAMQPNYSGELVRECWEALPNHYPFLNNQIFIVMPNHVHGIIMLAGENRRSGSKPDPTKSNSLSEVIRGFKSHSSRAVNEARHSQGTTVWQRSFYEQIIRTEKEYREIGEYIVYNAAKWDNDSENPYLLNTSRT
jgi:putative transposase